MHLRSKLALSAFLAMTTGCSFGERSWQCQAESGRYLPNRWPASPSIHTLSGRIQFNRGDFGGGDWNPIAHIAFTDSKLPSGRDCFCNGLRAEIFPSEPETVKFFMIFNGQESGIAQSPLGKPITFRLSVDDQGTMTAVVGKTNPVTQTAILAHPQRDTVHMSCSGADVSFRNLKME